MTYGEGRRVYAGTMNEAINVGIELLAMLSLVPK